MTRMRLRRRHGACLSEPVSPLGQAPVGITQHESCLSPKVNVEVAARSKTILASTRHPYNRFIFRPLTPPLGGAASSACIRNAQEASSL